MTVLKAEIAEAAILKRLGPITKGGRQPTSAASFVEDWSSKGAFLQLQVKHRFAGLLLRDIDEISYGYLADNPNARFFDNKIASIQTSPDGACVAVLLTLRRSKSLTHLFCDMNVVSPKGALPKDVRNDIAVMQVNDAWPTQTTFLGWTHDKRAVYRSLVCVNDRSGGQGPHCDFKICASDFRPAPKSDGCAHLPGIGESDFPSAGSRPKVKQTSAVAEEQEFLSKLGELDPGTNQNNKSVQVGGGSAKLFLSVQIEKDAMIKTVFELTNQVTPAPQEKIANVRVTQVTQTADKRCVAIFGSFTYRTYYESVPYETPKVIAEVICRP